MRKRRNALGLLVAALAAAMLAGTVHALVPSDPQASHPTYAGLNLPAAWDVTSGSPRVVIAIVDTGIDPSHPDLAGAVRVGRDFVDRDDDATNPPGGHGTAVAGVAAARANNGIGGMGTCFSCALMSLRVLGLDGIALNTNTAAAIDYAVDHGAAVVNASIYGPHSPPTLRNAIVRARAAGVLVVAAAGNEGTAEPQYPAAFPETISVGAAATSTSLARYSSFGAWLKFAAPECAPVTAIGGGTDVGCATSVASPLVAGIVGLLRTQAPFATADELESALARTARPIPGSRHGLVDAAARARRARAAGAAPATGGRRRAGRRRVARGVLGRVVGCRAHGDIPMGALPELVRADRRSDLDPLRGHAGRRRVRASGRRPPPTRRARRPRLRPRSSSRHPGYESVPRSSVARGWEPC